MKHNELTVIPVERMESKIFYIRGRKVMFDRDLADLYGVTTGNLNLTVRRNKERFPDDDFMFQLTAKEFEAFKSLILQNANDLKASSSMSDSVYDPYGNRYKIPILRP